MDSRDPVPCAQPHTTQTFKVGTLTALSDGHLLAVDSPAVQDRLAKTCLKALPGYLGGDQTTQRLSQIGASWFGPSLEQADAGADWYRCDVVRAPQGRLADLAAADDEGRARPTRRAGPLRHLRHRCPRRAALRAGRVRREALLARGRRRRPAEVDPLPRQGRSGHRRRGLQGRRREASQRRAQVHLVLRVAHPGRRGRPVSGTGTAGCRRRADGLRAITVWPGARSNREWMGEISPLH